MTIQPLFAESDEPWESDIQPTAMLIPAAVLNKLPELSKTQSQLEAEIQKLWKVLQCGGNPYSVQIKTPQFETIWKVWSCV